MFQVRTGWIARRIRWIIKTQPSVSLLRHPILWNGSKLEPAMRSASGHLPHKTYAELHRVSVYWNMPCSTLSFSLHGKGGLPKIWQLLKNTGQNLRMRYFHIFQDVTQAFFKTLFSMVGPWFLHQVTPNLEVMKISAAMVDRYYKYTPETAGSCQCSVNDSRTLNVNEMKVKQCFRGIITIN